jgi:hypothetical protein
VNLGGNNFEHTRQILRSVGIPEAKYPDAPIRKPLIALSIAGLLRGFRVLPSIKLDREA